MEPDYKKHADELIDRFRLKRNTPDRRPEIASPEPRPLIINAPQDCVFYFGPTLQPTPAPKERRPWLGRAIAALRRSAP